MKKVFAVFLGAVIILTLAGCGAQKDESAQPKSGWSTLVELGDGLWYDSMTRIVYWWNSNDGYGTQYADIPSPYYAPNGLPYRYNPETGTYEMIVQE